MGLLNALSRGVQPSIGTDGIILGPVDPFSNLRWMYSVLRGLEFRRPGREELTTCREIVEIATIGGARAAHLESVTGSITPGKRADLVILDARRLNSAPVHNPYANIVLYMDISNVTSVLVDGEFVKWKGQLVGVDVPALVDRLDASARRLITSLNYPPTSIPGWLPGETW